MVADAMATYVLGDVHGCFATLQALLARLDFDPDRDRLWLVGDLVNRGPASLAVLRWAKGLAERMGGRFVAVLGNHDLRLIARHAGIGAPRPRDTLEEVLAAPDRDALVGWLAARPLLQREGDLVLVHAGLHPAWTPEEAERRARRLAAAFAGPLSAALLRPPSAPAELREALAAFTLLRTCTPDGRPSHFSGPPDEAPPGYAPWFRIPGRRSAEATVVFGHWAALGLLVEPNLVALDTGCVWGQRLTALRLDDRTVVEQEVRELPGALAPA
jgi:bis(5'-nucleosyl)-tetraphosphatase (symmetrical)